MPPWIVTLAKTELLFKDAPKNLDSVIASAVSIFSLAARIPRVSCKRTYSIPWV